MSAGRPFFVPPLVAWARCRRTEFFPFAMPSNSHGCGLPFPRPSVPRERLGLRRCASLCSALNWPRVLAATNANHSARPSFGPWVCASFRSRRNKSGAQPRSPKRSRVNPSLTTRELACRRQALGNERRAAHRRRSRKQPGPRLSEPQRRRRPGVQVRSAALPDRRLLRVRDPRSAGIATHPAFSLDLRP